MTLNSENVRWRYTDDTRTLVVSGCSPMPFFWNNDTDLFDRAPWFHLKEEVRRIILEPGISTVSPGAFAWFSSLKTVEASGVVRICSGAFFECRELEDIEIGNLSLVDVGSFEGCISLAKVGERNSKAGLSGNEIRFVDDFAFSRCGSLERVSLPNLKMVGEGAFFKCSSITSVIAEKLEFAGDNAFFKCSSIEKFKVGNQCTFGKGAIKDIPKGAVMK